MGRRNSRLAAAGTRRRSPLPRPWRLRMVAAEEEGKPPSPTAVLRFAVASGPVLAAVGRGPAEWCMWIMAGLLWTGGMAGV